MPTATAAPGVTTAPRLKSRRYGAHGHGYLLDGEKIDGVSSVLDVMPKQLKQWAADCAANFAVEQWETLSEQPLTKRLDMIRYAHRDVVGEAAARGTDIHSYGEKLAHGEPVEIPDELRGPVQAYARFLDRFQVEPVATEVVVGNLTHRYGGRGDMWANIGKLDCYAYVDLKTGKNVYESVVLQVAAYDGAEVWQPDGPESEQPYTEVDAAFVAHILPDDVRLLPVRGAHGSVKPGGPEFRTFLYLQQVKHWLDAHGFKGDEPLIEAAVRA